MKWEVNKILLRSNRQIMMFGLVFLAIWSRVRIVGCYFGSCLGVVEGYFEPGF